MKTAALYKIIAILSLFCFLTDLNVTYHWYYVAEKSGFGYNFWMVTIRWWCFWIAVCLGAYLAWRPIMILIVVISLFIIKLCLAQLSGIQTFFYNFPGAKSFYFGSLPFPSNLDAIAKLIFVTFTFIVLCLMIKETMNKKNKKSLFNNTQDNI